MTALTHSWYMTVRHLRALQRQPWWIAITLIQPIIYLVLYGQLFQQAVLCGQITVEGKKEKGVIPVPAQASILNNGFGGVASSRPISSRNSRTAQAT
jgi:ABC-2 type transport system permease protein